MVFLTENMCSVLSYPFFLLSWSRDGHKLVSASTDNIVSQWDVLSGDCDQRFRFPSPILKVQYHPRDQYVFSELFFHGVGLILFKLSLSS